MLDVTAKAGRYFTWGELVESQTARRDPALWEQQTNPPAQVVTALTSLVREILDPFRQRLGCPLFVSSGFRCLALNTRIGGAPNSAHVSGRAADLKAWGWLATDSALAGLRQTLTVSGAPVPRTPNGWLWRALALWRPIVAFDKAIAEFGEPGEPAWVHLQAASSGQAQRGLLLEHAPARGRYYATLSAADAIAFA